MGAAAELFHSSDAGKETLNKRVRPSAAQRDFLKENKDDLEKHLKNDLSERCGYPVSTFLQGSYKLHTLIRPVTKYDEYDVDVGVYVEWGEWDGAISPQDLREHAQRSLVEYNRTGQSESVDEPKERCSRVRYKQQFHIDTPIYHHNTDTLVARLATLHSGWELSDPEKMVRWFQARLDGDERAQVRRLTRYLKAWAALRFRDAAPSRPSSLMLTVLAVDAYAASTDEISAADDDALRAILTSIRNRLHYSSYVQNPVPSDGDRNLNRMDQQNFDNFVEALGQFADIAQRAIESDDDVEAATIWAEAFDYLFPLPDVEGILEESAGRGVAVVAPIIEVAISATEGGRSIRRHNEGIVEFVRIGEWLRFEIVNANALPARAQVKWIVRNTGEYAHKENDLGHSKNDNGSFVHDEKAAYYGRHFMDCEVRVDGRLYSLTRVPVVVTGLPMPPRHPPRPSYHRIGRR